MGTPPPTPAEAFTARLQALEAAVQILTLQVETMGALMRDAYLSRGGGKA